jgi:hypothetical protein
MYQNPELKDLKAGSNSVPYLHDPGGAMPSYEGMRANSSNILLRGLDDRMVYFSGS